MKGFFNTLCYCTWNLGLHWLNMVLLLRTFWVLHPNYVISLFLISLQSHVGASKLENVTIKLHGCFGDATAITWEMLKQYSSPILFMLPGLGNARTLTLDEDTIEVTSYTFYLFIIILIFDFQAYCKFNHSFVTHAPAAIMHCVPFRLASVILGQCSVWNWSFDF